MKMCSSLSMSREKADEICKHIKENSGALFGQKFWECRCACALLAQQKVDRWESRFLAIAKFRVFILHGKSVNSLKIEKSFNIVALRYLELLQHDQQLQFCWEERSGKASSSATSSTAPPMLHILVRFPDNHSDNSRRDNNNGITTTDDGEQEQQHNHHQQQAKQCCTVRDLALDLLATLKHYFPDVQRSLAKHFLAISPSLVADFPALPSSSPELPCHNFRRSYVAHCDWLELPFRDEVIWDIERIYFVHAQHELDLNDFSHLAAKDLQALIGAVQFSDFFTGVSATALRLQPEHVDALLTLVRRSHSLRSLRLCRCTMPKDFVSQLAAALALNSTLPLERLRLGELTIDDKKGMAQLGTLLPQLPALHTLFLTDCALGEKLGLGFLHALHHGIGLAAADTTTTTATTGPATARKESSLSVEGRAGGNDGDGCCTVVGASAIDHHHHSSPTTTTASKSSNKRSLHHSSTSSSSSSGSAVAALRRFQLRALNLSGNQLGNSAELAEQLANLVALSDGAMRLLDLGGTAVQLDRLWSALKLGGLGLEVLRLGGCYCSPSSSSSSKRSGGAGAKDSAQVTRELFTAVHSLRELNLSGTHIGPELLQGILDGLSANRHLPAGSLQLCLDSAIVGSAACVSVLEQQIGSCACVGTLSLRDNALEHEAFRLLSALGRAAHLRALDIGGANFFALKAAKKHAPVLAGILAELVKLVNNNSSSDVIDWGVGGQQQEEAETERPFIEDLSLADARLGPHLSVFLNALGLCGWLKRLDLSNNELGPAGARLLCKSLQLNHALRWLALDRNQIGPDGFAELARALRTNIALDGLQVPFSDAADCVMAMVRVPAERARFQLQMEEIEQCLERNRQLRTFSSTMDHPVVVDHLVQRVMHRLNNCCELYGLDARGLDADLKKAVFHKIAKLITGDFVAASPKNNSSDLDEATADHGANNANNNSKTKHIAAAHWDGVGGGGGDQCGDPNTLRTIADQLADRVERLADVDSECFVQQFLYRLTDQQGVQIQTQHRQADIGQQMCAANNRLGVALRDDLLALLDRYRKEFAWSRLFATVHQCLLAEDAQEVFHLHESAAAASAGGRHQRAQPPRAPLSSSIRKRMGDVMAQSSAGDVNGGGRTPQRQRHHRPESAVMASNDAPATAAVRPTAADAMAAVLMMSRSVVGDFAHTNNRNNTNNNSNADDDATTKTTASVVPPTHQKGTNNSSNLLSLTHLAKQRPKPARLLNRSRVQPTQMLDEQQQQNSENETNAPHHSSSALASFTENGHAASADSSDSGTMPSAVVAPHSSPDIAGANSSSHCPPRHLHHGPASPTPPPLPLCVRPTPSSPPAVPPRREKGLPAAGGGANPPMTPPRLPPKPPPASPAISGAGSREGL